MTPDVCMRFLIWSYYYHDVIPEKHVSYRTCSKFSEEDCQRLDTLKDMLFRCYEEQSVRNACKSAQPTNNAHAVASVPNTTFFKLLII